MTDMQALSYSETLVTGGGGLIGSSVIRAFAARGLPVRAHMGPPGAVVHDAPPGVPAAFADIDDVRTMTQLCSGASCVVHLAGPPSVAKSFDAPADSVRAHAAGTAAILEACRATRVPRLIYISSAEVYGRPMRNPVGEDHPRQPRSPYAASKACAEDLILTCCPSFGISATILRPFSVIGPNVPRASVLGSIVRQALGGPEIGVYAPQVIRDYLFVDDMAEAIFCCLSRDPEPAAVSIYNIGSGVGTSVEALGAAVQSKLGKKPNVRLAAGLDRPQAADIEVLIADITKAATELGWRPQISLDAALSSIINSFQIESTACGS
jgi:nucleoside-diphosphate-sugar epimerase